jgi:hypothetical protein
MASEPSCQQLIEAKRLISQYRLNKIWDATNPLWQLFLQHGSEAVHRVFHRHNIFTPEELHILLDLDPRIPEFSTNLRQDFLSYAKLARLSPHVKWFDIDHVLQDFPDMGYAKMLTCVELGATDMHGKNLREAMNQCRNVDEEEFEAERTRRYTRKLQTHKYQLTVEEIEDIHKSLHLVWVKRLILEHPEYKNIIIYYAKHKPPHWSRVVLKSHMDILILVKEQFPTDITFLILEYILHV